MTAKQKMTKTTPSSVCRVNKSANYTVMSNYHLRSPHLSLKAVGLLSKVLSLPDEWDYSIAGLTAICTEKETAIKSALNELKKWGYLTVTKMMPNETESGRIEYVYDFFEYSEKDQLDCEQGCNDNGDTSQTEVSSKKFAKQGVRKQGIENLPVEILPVEIQSVENQGQLNTKKKIQKKQIRNDQVSIHQSSPNSETSVESSDTADRLMDKYVQEQQIYTEVVKATIEFEEFREWITSQDSDDDKEAEEIVAMIVRAICSSKPIECICGQDFPREVIKSAMLRVDIICLQNAIEQMKQTDNICNHEKYLISTLFNEANGRHFRENAESRWAGYAVKRDFGY